MTTTADGCLRLYAAGARRPAAMLRGPREGVAAVAAVGVEAFVAAAGAGGYVARYDLASGRELGALLAVPADDSGAEYSGLGYAAAGAKRLACVAAGGPGSGLVAAAGEGGDVHLWDSRVAPRGSRRASSAVGSTAPGSTGALSSGVAPVMTLRVPGASSVSSVSLAADGVTLATTASNGARVFDLRAPASDRPARLASKEPGQRWASAFHVGEEIFTVSTAGDVFAWARKDEAMSYAAPFRTARAHRDAAYVAKREECLSGSIRDSAFGDQGAASASASASASFRVPAFACSASALGVSNTRVVLTASGDRGECVRAWDAESGDTLAEWGADGGVGGGAAAAYGARGFAGVAHAPVTALCWGSGPEGERFGKTSFAVGTAEGIVRVYGP
jgi:WD40 repeat protein